MLEAARWQTHHVSQRDLLVLTEEPLNAETRLDRQRGVITPAGRHYVRSHFPIPIGPTVLELDGARRIELSLAEIRAMPSRTVRVTLECAGNGRRFLEPAVPGEQWGLGAVGTAEWTGVPLARLLEEAGLRPNTAEVLFRGADRGIPKDLHREIAFERSLPIADALREDVMVAYAMNGAPVAREHGGPLRLVVAGWYGMASVKWLAAIALLERPFSGFFQADRYVIDGRPLREIAPRAVIASPAEGAVINGGEKAPTIEVRGYAWSGAGRIAKVEIMAGPAGASAAETWREATLGEQASPYSWREFSLRTLVALDNGGPEMDVGLMARATDETGNAQPLGARWNALGYANNAVHPVRIRIRA
ncbi:MAG: sulfite oxidase [Chloroflexi bacterium]|nr:MAG: sulfite oxidase [Chloroflexota bacterium]